MAVMPNVHGGRSAVWYSSLKNHKRQENTLYEKEILHPQIVHWQKKKIISEMTFFIVLPFQPSGWSSLEINTGTLGF